MSYKCEILADSLSPQRNRLTTMKITFPRFILAEFNTHRMFSRNSASSRAIPFKKMVQMVEENPFIPIAWQKDHKGMQGNEYFTDSDKISLDTGGAWAGGVYTDFKAPELLNSEWKEACKSAIKEAKRLNSLGVTKQLCNRLLEPFMWHTVIVTATEWENFFNLRCPQYEDPSGKLFKSKKDYINNSEWEGCKEWSLLDWLGCNKSQAEIHIQAIAELMWDAYNESKPKQLQSGEWHIPFGDNIDTSGWNFTQDNKVKIAVARCARISYETLGDNPKIDYEADLKLYEILAKSGHYSPFEHVARAMSVPEYELFKNSFWEKENTLYTERGWCRNFKGFIQQRVLID